MSNRKTSWLIQMDPLFYTLSNTNSEIIAILYLSTAIFIINNINKGS